MVNPRVRDSTNSLLDRAGNSEHLKVEKVFPFGQFRYSTFFTFFSLLPGPAMAAVVLNTLPKSRQHFELEDVDSACSVDSFTGKPNSQPSHPVNDDELYITSDDERIYGEEQPTIRKKTLNRVLVRVAIFITIALASLGLCLVLAHETLDIEIPRTLAELKESALHLESVAQETWTGYTHVTFVFAVLYLWQQAFSIPGSILLNLLAGYLYGAAMGGLWTSALTAGGATLAYFLAYLICEPFMDLTWVVNKMDVIRTQVNVNKQNGGLFWWLLFARLFPFTPYW
jgi:uncharacterized membrane protein YdjX (TVP38/TMEM64 family)